MNGNWLLLLTVFCFGSALANVEELTSDDHVVKSIVNEISTDVKFVNKSSHNAKVFWLDYDGNPVKYLNLAPEESYVQQTYVTHPWIAKDATTDALMLVNGHRVHFPVDCGGTVAITDA